MGILSNGTRHAVLGERVEYVVRVDDRGRIVIPARPGGR